MLTFEEHFRLQKVISGGQIGADEAGLYAAFNLGFLTGGTAPLGYRTQNGPNLMLRDKYGLSEDLSYNYKPRTIKNVADSCGTLVIAKNLHSPGCILTTRTAIQKKKPLLPITVPHDRFLTDGELEAVHVELAAWLKSKQISTLNVAGNRDHIKNSYPLFDTVVNILVPVFERILDEA